VRRVGRSSIIIDRSAAAAAATVTGEAYLRQWPIIDHHTTSGHDQTNSLFCYSNRTNVRDVPKYL